MTDALTLYANLLKTMRMEDDEETAKLFFLLEGRRARFLTMPQLADLEKHFPS